MGHTGYIYQPHFKTQKFRVAVKDQIVDGQWNYIVVTCSPEYNGVYRYPSHLVSTFSIWKNGNLKCYEVPIEKCEYYKKLEDIKNKDTINRIKVQQRKWFNGEVLNSRAYKGEEPEWMLK